MWTGSKDTSTSLETNPCTDFLVDPLQYSYVYKVNPPPGLVPRDFTLGLFDSIQPLVRAEHAPPRASKEEAVVPLFPELREQ
jgi:hypothetical protein